MTNQWARRRPSGRIAYVDGRYLPHAEAGVHVEDRGFQLGDSVYEVLRISAGRFFDQEEHLDRLERSLGEIEMAAPMSRAALKQVMNECVRRNVVIDGLLYMQVTRGSYRRDHPIPQDRHKPSLVITVHSIDVDALSRKRREGVAVITVPDQRWRRCDIKTTQLLANLLAKTAARASQASEAWLVDSEGFVTEGASTTAWIVDREGRLVTRQLSHAILPGVTRRVLLALAADAQIAVVERPFTPKEAALAQEAFLTSASGDAIPVVRIDGQPIGGGTPGSVTRRIAELYAEQHN